MWLPVKTVDSTFKLSGRCSLFKFQISRVHHGSAGKEETQLHLHNNKRQVNSTFQHTTNTVTTLSTPTAMLVPCLKAVAEGNLLVVLFSCSQRLLQNTYITVECLIRQSVVKQTSDEQKLYYRRSSCSQWIYCILL